MCAVAIFGVTIGEFAAQLSRQLADYQTVIGVAVIVFLTALNWLRLEIGGGAQQLLSLAKVAGLIIIVAGCFALQMVTEAYAGWNSSIYFTEEDHDAERNAPRALYWGILVVMIIYAIVNAALLIVLPFEVLGASPLPVADAAKVIFGGAADRVVTVLAIVSVLGILNVTLMFSPRILFAMSRDGLVLAQAAELNRFAVPGKALLVTAAPAVLFVVAGSTFEFLYAMTAFLGVAVNAAVYVTYFALRHREPELPRPHRALGHPWLPALVTGISLALLGGFVVANVASSLVSLAIIAASYPLYRRLRG